jgi:hypothetical protein
MQDTRLKAKSAAWTPSDVCSCRFSWCYHQQNHQLFNEVITNIAVLVGDNANKGEVMCLFMICRYSTSVKDNDDNVS